MRPKIRSSVSIVLLENNIVEFFLSNTRRQVRLKLSNNQLTELLLSLDGTKTIEEISLEFCQNFAATEALQKLILFLQQRSVIVDADFDILNIGKKDYRRVLHFLEDYSSSPEDLKRIWNRIINSHVVIVGLGAVGTWVATLLAQSGVSKFTLVDFDTIEVSNLHRQLSYFEDDIGKLKTKVTARNILKLNPNAEITIKNEKIEEGSLDDYLEDVDLVINCADSPTVDETSKWIGMSCMPLSIPHIIAGGYNLHISLIGQTVIPYHSACIKCFEVQLAQMNIIDPSNLRKLAIENRKIGSFGPMCAISASMVSMEAIKVLSGGIRLANINRRGEFDIYQMDLTYTEVAKLSDCEWCGEKGIYTQLAKR